MKFLQIISRPWKQKRVKWAMASIFVGSPFQFRRTIGSQRDLVITVGELSPVLLLYFLGFFFLISTRLHKSEVGEELISSYFFEFGVLQLVISMFLPGISMIIRNQRKEFLFRSPLSGFHVVVFKVFCSSGFKSVPCVELVIYGRTSFFPLFYDWHLGATATCEVHASVVNLPAFSGKKCWSYVTIFFFNVVSWFKKQGFQLRNECFRKCIPLPPGFALFYC